SLRAWTRINGSKSGSRSMEIPICKTPVTPWVSTKRAIGGLKHDRCWTAVLAIPESSFRITASAGPNLSRNMTSPRSGRIRSSCSILPPFDVSFQSWKSKRNKATMNGQWSGSYRGTNSGLLVMDLDDMDTHYEGRVFAYDDTPALPGTFAFIKTPDKRSSFQLSVDFLPVDPRTGVRQRFG